MMLEIMQVQLELLSAAYMSKITNYSKGYFKSVLFYLNAPVNLIINDSERFLHRSDYGFSKPGMQESKILVIEISGCITIF